MVSNTLKSLTVCLAVCAGLPASAQTVLGVTLGEPIPEGLPAPLGTMVEPPLALTRWLFDDGLAMSATADAETGDVLYLELWRDGRQGTPTAPVAGFTYGETTLAEVTDRFGSDGMFFPDRERFMVLGDVVAYFTSYEVAQTDAIVTFITIQPTPDAAPETLGASVLDAISLSSGFYMDEIWGGNRGRSEGYEQIADPFIP